MKHDDEGKWKEPSLRSDYTEHEEPESFCLDAAASSDALLVALKKPACEWVK